MEERLRRLTQALLLVLAACGIFNTRVSHPSLIAQEKSPSIGKITYKPATPSAARAARVVGPLTATQGKAVLLVLTEPEGAQVSINGQAKGVSDAGGVYREEVPINKEYKIVVQANKYLPYEESYRIASSQPQLVRATLTATFGALRIYNVPQDAALSLDDQKIQYKFEEGKNEVVLAEISVGTHQLKIDHRDFVEWDSSVNVVPGYEVVVTPTLVPAAKVILSSLPAVEVLIDAVKQGVTDAEGKLSVRTPLQPGKHELVMSKPGFVTLSKAINLARGDNTLNEPELEPAPSYAEFVDFFNDGLGLWEAPSAWQWVNNQKAVAVQGPEPGFVKNLSFRDFDFEFNVRFSNKVGAAWTLRAKNPKNYYLFQLSVKERLLKSYLVEDGKITQVQSSNVLVDPGASTSYLVRAEVQGSRIRHYLKNNATADEELMGILPDVRFNYGTVGLAMVSGEQFLVEDIRVKPYPESAPR